MTIQPSEYGKKEIKELSGESVLLLTKAANEMGIINVGDMSPHSVKAMKKNKLCLSCRTMRQNFWKSSLASYQLTTRQHQTLLIIRCS